MQCARSEWEFRPTRQDALINGMHIELVVQEISKIPSVHLFHSVGIVITIAQLIIRVLIVVLRLS